MRLLRLSWHRGPALRLRPRRPLCRRRAAVAFENRPLAPAPQPSDGWDALGALAPWAADHVPGRKGMVEAGAWLDYFVLGTLPDAAPGERAVSPVPGPAGPFLASPQVVRGGDGYLFFGEDFDASCVQGSPYPSDMQTLADMAQTITIADGASCSRSLPTSRRWCRQRSCLRFLPHGQCTSDGIALQKQVLTEFEHPLFLPVLPEMQRAQTGGQSMYWKTDTHWSPAGSATYARLLAEKLDADAAEDVRVVRRGSVTRLGDLARLAGLTFTETVPQAQVQTGARSRFLDTTTTYDTQPDWSSPHRWKSVGGTHAPITGHTVLIGDSFTYYALPNLMPLFDDAEFFWGGVLTPIPNIMAGIAAADTVVIEVAERYVGPYNQSRDGSAEAGARRRAVAAPTLSS